jgi:hypothetical protein
LASHVLGRGWANGPAAGMLHRSFEMAMSCDQDRDEAAAASPSARRTLDGACIKEVIDCLLHRR